MVPVRLAVRARLCWRGISSERIAVSPMTYLHPERPMKTQCRQQEVLLQLGTDHEMLCPQAALPPAWLAAPHLIPHLGRIDG